MRSLLLWTDHAIFYSVILMLALLISPAAQSAPQTYNHTGGPQIYVVPAGITSIAVDVRGSQGSDGTEAIGGQGGAVSATIAVTPGEVLQVMVGGRGGFNGGGYGGGGGASDIRSPAFNTVSSCAYQLSCGLAERLLVAGGGGGAGTFAGSHGGDAGQTGTSGANGGTGSIAGAGATTTAGGAAGSSSGEGAAGGPYAGSLGAGGGQGWKPDQAGGGGGGGYYGGGGGGAATGTGASGGGGGSSWAAGSGVTDASFADASVTGNGAVTIDPPSAIPDAAFAFTGETQNYTVPAGVTQLAVMLRGGGGGAGGEGDVVSGRLPVTPGQVLQIVLGGRGSSKIASPPAGALSGGEGGYNGGGSSSAGLAGGSVGGGGASDIRVDPYALEDRVVVAGGGGGSDGFLVQFGWSGATGGAVATGQGGSAGRNPGEGIGQGGLLTAGGQILGSDGVTPNPDAPAGSSGAWLTGGSSSGYAGGGGGYYGGAAFLGGGGGSSYASVTGPDPTMLGVGNVLGQPGAPFQHARGGSAGEGSAVLTAMPIVTTGLYQTSATEVSIVGTVNPKFLAASPKLYYSDVSAEEINTGGGSVIDMVGPNAAPILAGDTVQDVSGAITGLATNTTYYYRVCAQSVAGLACGNTLSLITAAPPGAPTIGTATAGDAQISVAFTVPTSDGGSPITGYTATCTSTDGGATGTGTGSASPIVVASLTNGKSYTCTVTATNESGPGAASAPSNSVTPSGGGGGGGGTPAPVNGACGSANGGTFTNAPTTNLCSVGTTSALSGSGPWTWSCTGSDGGSTASCSASRAAVATTTTLTSAPNPSRVGEAVTLTATVSAATGIPTGTVAFQEGGGVISGCASQPLTGGVATCVTAGLSVGSPALTAQYSGTAAHAASSGTLTPAQQVLERQGNGTSPGGPVSAAITGGSCVGFAGNSAQFTAPVNPPVEEDFRYGVFGFTALGCGAGGTVTITLTYPAALPVGTKYWKQINGVWEDWTNRVTISGNTVTLTLTDGGDGDTNPNPGAISDPSGPAVPATDIPTLSEWAMLLLGLLLVGMGWRQPRRFG